MEVDRHAPAATTGSAAPTIELASSKVTVLRGHQSEVLTCAWSPVGDIIVSGLV